MLCNSPSLRGSTALAGREFNVSPGGSFRQRSTRWLQARRGHADGRVKITWSLLDV